MSNEQTKQDSITDLGRFSEPALLVLASLAGGPKHGYAMVEDIERLAGIRLRPTTLYAVLARLEHRKLVEALAPEDRRHPYRLTGAGATALREQLRSMETFAAAGLKRLAVSFANG